MKGDETRLTEKRLKSCRVGRDLYVIHGMRTGTWNNLFVAKMAAEILKLRRKLREVRR